MNNEFLEKLEKVLGMESTILSDIKAGIAKQNVDESLWGMLSQLVSIFNVYNGQVGAVDYDQQFYLDKIDKIKKYIVCENYDAANELITFFIATTMILEQNLQMCKKYITYRCRERSIIYKQLILKYKDSNDEEIKKIIDYMIDKQSLEVFNYEFMEKYADFHPEVYHDEFYDMKYVMYNGKRMYMKRGMDDGDIQHYVKSIVSEQDILSPHRYLSKDFYVPEGAIVVDAGVAEGNFALDVIDNVKEIYLIECDDAWIEALQLTFQNYVDKVHIVKKMLCNYTDETHITIDELVQEKQIDFIKMDIEGAEIDALSGAEKVMKSSEHLQCAICAYHRQNDEARIKEVLSAYGYQTSTTSGYMFFGDDIDASIYVDLRRGIVRGIKE